MIHRLHIRNSKYTLLKIAFVFSLNSVVFSQQAESQDRSFVSVKDTTKYPSIQNSVGGFSRKYIETEIQILEIDPGTKYYVAKKIKALLCFEGVVKNKKKEGVFDVYIMDSLVKSKKYKLYSQTYSNDKLNGIWKTYSIEGNLATTQMFKDDSLHGISRNYFSDGKTLINEVEYFKGSNRYIRRSFYSNGKLKAEIPYLNEVMDGLGKKYYESGTLAETAEFKNGVFHGHGKYFYPNGQLWNDIMFKEGKFWTAISNYSEKGVKRNAGTLLNGNGTVIYYNDDGTVREIITYVGGVKKQI